MSWRSATRLIALGLCAISMNGCRGSQKFSAAQAEQARVVLFSESGAGRFLLAAQAEDQIAKCMKVAGYDFDRAGLQLSGETVPPVGTYGVSFTEKPNEVAPIVDANGPTSPGYLKALMGSRGPGEDPSPDGCLSQGLVIMKQMPFDSRVMERLNRKYEASYLSDPRTVELTKDWSPCMKAAGFKFAGPNAINDSLEVDLKKVATDEDLLRLQKKERAIFSADTSCQEPFKDQLAVIRKKYELLAAQDYMRQFPKFVLGLGQTEDES